MLNVPYEEKKLMIDACFFVLMASFYSLSLSLLGDFWPSASIPVVRIFQRIKLILVKELYKSQECLPSQIHCYFRHQNLLLLLLWVPADVLECKYFSMFLSNLVKNRLYGHYGVDVLKNDIKEHSVEIQTINNLL